MNQHKLTEFYPWSDSASSRSDGQFIMCLDRNSTSGEFSFLYLLLKSIKDSTPVKLVCCNHSPNHYVSILRKNNVNAMQLQATGKLEIVQVTDVSSTANITYSWEQLLDWQEKFQQQCGGVALFVDDLDALELVAPTERDARRFMTRSIELLSAHDYSGSSGSLGGGLLQLIAFGRHPVEAAAELTALGDPAWNGDSSGLSASLAGRTPPSSTEQEPALCEYLRYRADVTVAVSALATGYSSAVHGVVAVSVRSVAPRRQTLQYKALDSGVLCTLVGLTTF